MLPAFEMGYLYKKKIEEKDTLPNGIYFGILLTIQLCIVLTCAGLAYSTVWCASFANGPVVPYLTTITGIAFWLRISKILSPLFSHMRILRQIGKNTYSIMMHHILAFMLVKDIVFIVPLLISRATAKSGWKEIGGKLIMIGWRRKGAEKLWT